MSKVRKPYDPLAVIASSGVIRERLGETLALAERLKILLDVAERIEATEMADLTADDSADLDLVPDPETVRVMLAKSIRRSDLLRSLLRVAIRKANYPPPTRRTP